jgi:predicted phosphodiesterase
MRIFYFSDLHLEQHGARGGVPEILDMVSLLPDDVIVLAGDITSNMGEYEWMEQFCTHPNVIYVPGNHEYYDWQFPQTLDAIRARVPKNVTVLDRESTTICGVRFHGATLWSNFRYGDPITMMLSKKFINDFNLIEGMDVLTMYREHGLSLAWLNEVVNPGDVVITHFPLTRQSVHEKYDDNPLNGYFVNDCEAIVRNWNAKLLIHGHTHSSFDYMLGGTRVVCNPYGYGRENPEFFGNKFVKI